MGRLYSVPSLIVFPGHLLPVSDASQTEQFFASNWSQYAGVDEVQKQVVVLAEAPGTVWADVTWFHGGRACERFCYQLVEGTEGYQVAVLTLMALAEEQNEGTGHWSSGPGPPFRGCSYRQPVNRPSSPCAVW